MVVDGEKGSVWLNGKTGIFNPTKAIASNSIAVSEEGKEAFYGEIYEVRYSTLTAGSLTLTLILLITRR